LEKLRSLRVSSCIYHFECKKFSKASAMLREPTAKVTQTGDNCQFKTPKRISVELHVSSCCMLPDIQLPLLCDTNDILGLNQLPWQTQQSSGHPATPLGSHRHQALLPPALLTITSQPSSWRSAIQGLKTLRDEEEEAAWMSPY